MEMTGLPGVEMEQVDVADVFTADTSSGPHAEQLPDDVEMDGDVDVDGSLRTYVPEARKNKLRKCCFIASLAVFFTGIVLILAFVLLNKDASLSSRASELTHKILSYGPRTVGDTSATAGHARTRALITHTIGALGGLFEPVREQVFSSDETPKGRMTFRNLYTRSVTTLPGLEPCHVVLAAHYDTLTREKLPGFVGAIDSATGLGLILSAAEQFNRTLGAARGSQTCNVTLLFVDGEESFVRWDKKDSVYGSTYFAGAWRKDAAAVWGGDGDYTLPSVTLFVLLDLLGSKDCSIPLYSKLVKSGAADYNKLVALQDEVGGPQVFSGTATSVTLEDDHLPFLAETCDLGCVPILHLISYTTRFPAVWHTNKDTWEAVDHDVMQTLDVAIGRWLVWVAAEARGRVAPPPASTPTGAPAVAPATGAPATPATLAPETVSPRDAQAPPPVTLAPADAPARKSVRTITTEFLSFGPRPVVPVSEPEDEGHRKSWEYLVDFFKTMGTAAFEPLVGQTFLKYTPIEVGLETVERRFTNFYSRAVAPPPAVPSEKCHVVLTAHYDTLVRRAHPNFTGATDSASGIALILRMAQNLTDSVRAGATLRCNVSVVFFDGEESFKRWQHSDSVVGSAHFAEAWNENRVAGWGEDWGLSSVTSFALLDLLGASKCQVPYFGRTRTLGDYNTLKDIEAGFLAHHQDVSPTVRTPVFQGTQSRYVVEDDHIPFERIAGQTFPVLHLIAYPFPVEWHNVNGVPDIIDALDWGVMAKLDFVFLEWIYRKAVA